MNPARPLNQENQRIRRVAVRSMVLTASVLAAGTVGYEVLEGWLWLDGLYMTVITLATIGFGETHPLSDAGRLFTIALILIGVSNLGYALAEMTAFFAGGGLQAYRHRERMDKMTKNLRNHTIVCGCGRLGAAVAEELHSRGVPLLIIDRDDKALTKLRLVDVPFLLGDANDDAILQQAGIDRAGALVAALNDDAHNVFLTLTARVLTRETNPNLAIHGKAEDPATLVKLKRAGATHAFSPSRVLGHRIAHQIMRPAITDLVELATGQGDVDLGIEEIGPERMGAVGKPLNASPLWGKPEVLVLAVRNHAGVLTFPPRGGEVLQAGDRVVVMGRTEHLAGFMDSRSDGK